MPAIGRPRRFTLPSGRKEVLKIIRNVLNPSEKTDIQSRAISEEEMLCVLPVPWWCFSRLLQSPGIHILLKVIALLHGTSDAKDTSDRRLAL